MKCPKCNSINKDDAIYCWLCHELFQGREKNAAMPIQPVVEKPQEKPFGGQGLFSWKKEGIFLLGLLVFPLVNNFFLTNFIFQFLGTLVHELGHTLMFLLFGTIAIPSLYLSGGGKATPISTGNIGIFVVIGLLVYLIYYLRRVHKVLMAAAIVFTVVYTLTAFSIWKNILISSAGHLGEIAWVGICFYRCLIAMNTTSAERLIYAVSGWYLLIDRLVLFNKLKTNPSARLEYIESGSAKGALPDLIQIADDLNLPFEPGANTFIVLSLVPIFFVVFLVLRKQ